MSNINLIMGYILHTQKLGLMNSINKLIRQYRNKEYIFNGIDFDMINRI